MIEVSNGPASPPNRLQRSTLKTLFVTTIVLAALSVPVAIFGLIAANLFIQADQIGEIRDSTGMAYEAVIIEATVIVGLLIAPLPLLTTAVILLGRYRKRQRLSSAAVKAERALSKVGATLTSATARGWLERCVSTAAFLLSLGAVYALLGIDSAFDTREQMLESVAFEFLMIVDPIVLAYAIPGIVLGVICRKQMFEFDGLALTGTVISVLCLVVSFTKVGSVLPIITHGIVQALSHI